eukprot:CAMPEP_0194319740 /NCGR_PEP_ID=MMETSP0171-20130528/16167_1 /TAXON_ID=218684 /ORGANISM="Corethron pennatum, Strain L29A3" /LENGTH=412 /DNA_ID=CAMNT_0039077071 /DNA_START=32 /DNA_END=1270 /DNA_ORIENTATION=-
MTKAMTDSDGIERGETLPLLIATNSVTAGIERGEIVTTGAVRSADAPPRPRGILSTFFICRYCLHFVFVYVLVATGSAAVFLRGFLQLSHVQLEKASLEQENTHFGVLLKEGDEINSDLEEKIGELREQNADYARQNSRFAALNVQLNATSTELNELVQNLQAQAADLESSNAAFAALNANLNRTAADLRDVVKDLGGELSGLNSTAVGLKLVSEVLETRLEEFERTATTLGEEVEKLTTVVGFLEVNAENNQRNFTNLVDTLANTIVENQAILDEISRQRLKGDYAANVRNGLRDLRTYADVLSNFNTSARTGDLFDDLLKEVQTDVLDEICGDVADFDAYVVASSLEGGSNRGGLTFNDILDSTFFYVDMLQNYYFPQDADSGVEGITAAQWKKADYKCINLDPQVTLFL